MEPTTATTRAGAGLSAAPSAGEAAAAAAREAAAGLDGAAPDLAFLFLSADHADGAADALAAAREELRPAQLVGCVAAGVVGRDVELERGPGAAVWAATLPGAEITCFHAAARDDEDGVAVEGFPAADDASLAVLLADPYTFPAAPFLEQLAQERPRLAVVGGLAVGRGGAGGQALFLEDEIAREGAVGAVIAGVPVATVVSQGCTPIGREAVITSAEGNVVHELAGEPALERLRADLGALPPAQQRLAAEGLLAGLVVDENKAEYGRGDYLMRGIVGIDEGSGSLAVGAPVRVGQTLRFHVRDAEGADADLESALVGVPRPVAGALMFTCNGRGVGMFAEPHHDARAVADALGRPPLAGFFCAGEIGPVGGTSFLHGFTATLAVFLR